MRPATLLSLASLLPAAIVPAARAQDWTFADGLESGDACAWSARVGSADDCSPIATTVFEIRMGNTGGPFLFSNVVVTARSADGRHFWIADDPTCEPFHGVFVFRGVSAAPLGPAVAPGAAIDLTAFAIELDAQPPGDTLTELLWGEPALVGDAGPPTPVAVPAISDLDGAESLEGVLIQLPGGVVTAAAAGDRLTLSDGAGTTVLDDLAFDYAASDYPVGTCFSSVTGIFHLDTLLDERQLLPRSAADLVVATCP